jgi:hypothetical protein
VTGMDAPNPHAGEEFTHVNTRLFGLIPSWLNLVHTVARDDQR